MPAELQTLTTSLGHTITAYRNDHVGDKIALNGLYEKENLGLLMKLLKRISSPEVMDVGANIGNHALAFSTVASQVLAFEPLPAVFDLLEKNVRCNAIDNILTYPFALSDVDEEATIYMVREGNVGASSFDRRDDNVEAVTVRKPGAEWIDMLNEAGIPCGPIYSVDQVFADPQVSHLHAAVEVEHPRLGKFRVLNQAARLSRTPAAVVSATPEIGQHTDEVLAELGYSATEIAELHAKEVV